MCHSGSHLAHRDSLSTPGNWRRQMWRYSFLRASMKRRTIGSRSLAWSTNATSCPWLLFFTPRQPQVVSKKRETSTTRSKKRRDRNRSESPPTRGRTKSLKKHKCRNTGTKRLGCLTDTKESPRYGLRKLADTKETHPGLAS